MTTGKEKKRPTTKGTGDELMCSVSGTLHAMLNNKKYR